MSLTASAAKDARKAMKNNLSEAKKKAKKCRSELKKLNKITAMNERRLGASLYRKRFNPGSSTGETEECMKKLKSAKDRLAVCEARCQAADAAVIAEKSKQIALNRSVSHDYLTVDL